MKLRNIALLSALTFASCAAQQAEQKATSSARIIEKEKLAESGVRLKCNYILAILREAVDRQEDPRLVLGEEGYQLAQDCQNLELIKKELDELRGEKASK